MADFSKLHSHVVLNGKANYPTWAFTVRNHLEAANLINHIEGNLLSVEDKDKNAVKDDSGALKAKSFIISTLAESQIEHIIHCDSAAQIWAHFLNAYGKKTSNEKLELMRDLTETNCSTASDVAGVVNKVLTIRGKLKMLGVELDDVMVISAIMKALPPSFKTFLESWSLFDIEHQTLARFTEKLLERAKGMESEETHRAFLATSRGRGQFRGRGGSNGHRRMDSARHGDKTVVNSSSGSAESSSQAVDKTDSNICHYCKKPGHWLRECKKLAYKRSKEAEAKGLTPHVNFMAVAGGNNDFENPAMWIIDSGCSAHMSPHSEWFTSYTAFHEPVKVKLGDNSVLDAIGVGTIQTTVGSMQRVHLVPNLAFNLISLTALLDSGLDGRVRPNGWDFYKDQNLVFKANRQGPLYLTSFEIVQPAQAALTAATLDHWHRRFAHLPVELVEKMLKLGSVDGLRVAHEEKEKCLDCALSKCKRAPHPSSTSPKATAPGVSLHFDIMGPISPESIGGSKYILTGRDEFSRFRFTTCLKSKAQTAETIIFIINQTLLHTGNEVLKVTSDNGGEFVNDRLAVFFQQKGIQHCLSVPHTPQQNGTAERENSSIISRTTAQLASTNLPENLWAESVVASTYVSNRSISKSSDTTPFELWFGRKPNVANFKIFGQQAVVLKANRKGKFDVRGTLMYFVGYTDKFNTFRFYDPATKLVKPFCDALFLNKFGMTTESVVHQTRREGSDGGPVLSLQTSENSNPSAAPDVGAVTEVTNSELTTSKLAEPEPLPKTVPPLTRTASTSALTGHDASMEFQIQHGEDRASAENLNQTANESQFFSASDSTTSLSKERGHQFSPTGEEEARQEPHRTPVAQSQEPCLTDDLTLTNESQLGQPNHLRDPPEESVSAGRSVGVGDTRPQRNRNHHNYKLLSKGVWDMSALVAQAKPEPPKSFTQAMKAHDAEAWKEAMDDEILAMQSNEVFELVDRAEANNVLGSLWVLSYKSNDDGSLKTKARLVALGSHQVYQIDYEHTYAPVVYADSIRFIFAQIALRKLKVAQFDVSTAFLNGELKEQIYMEQPQGYSTNKNEVWRLKRSIYGLRQSPKVWYQCLAKYLSTLGLKQTTTDECIFYKKSPLTIVMIYVDDGIVASTDESAVEMILNALKNRFKTRQVQSKKFVGFEYDVAENGDVMLHQQSYIQTIVKRFGMEGCNTAPTPMTVCSRNQASAPLDESVPYKQAIGALQYAATHTRPDIAHTVGILSRAQKEPTDIDWQTVKRCLRYLSGSMNMGIRYSSEGPSHMIAYSDADYAGDVGKSYKSTTGSLIMLAGGPISWRSKLQDGVATSTTEAEFTAISTTIQSVSCLRDLSIELGLMPVEAVQLKSDNRGAVLITMNEASAQRTRHLGARLMYAREMNNKKVVDVGHIGASDQLADMLTKSLSNEKFTVNRGKFMFSLLMMTCVFSLIGQVDSRIPRTNISDVVWLETDHVVEIGRTRVPVVFKHKNPCEKYEQLEDKLERGSLKRNITASVRAGCYQALGELFDPLELKIMNIAIRSNRKARDVVISETPVEGGGAWQAAGAILLPGADTVGQYLHPDSARNTVWRHEKEIKFIYKEVKKHQAQFNQQFSTNTQLIDSSRTLIDQTKSTVNQLTSGVDYLPSIMQSLSQTLIDLRREADLRETIVRGFERGVVEIDALGKLVNLPSAVYKLKPEWTKFDKIQFNGSEVYHFFYPIIDDSVRFYKAQTFKIWQDEDRYTMKAGPNFVMHNETNNCSRFLPEPKELLLLIRCEKPNHTYESTTKHSVKSVILNDENREIETEPTIVVTNTARLIQCFPHNITVAGENEPCGTSPFNMLLNSSLQIKGAFHEYQSISPIERGNATLNLPGYDEDEDLDPWKDKFEQARKSLDVAATMNKQMHESNNMDIIKFATSSLQDHPFLSFTSVSVVFIVVVLLILYLTNKDPIASLVKMQILSNIAQGAQNKTNFQLAPVGFPVDSRPVTPVTPITPTAPASANVPQVLISIGNSYVRPGQSDLMNEQMGLYPSSELLRPPTPYPPKYTRNGSQQSVEPTPCPPKHTRTGSISSQQSIRPATKPPPPPDTASCKSVSSDKSQVLDSAPIKPPRLPKKDKFLSTLSLPAAISQVKQFRFALD